MYNQILETIYEWVKYAYPRLVVVRDNDKCPSFAEITLFRSYKALGINSCNSNTLIVEYYYCVGDHSYNYSKIEYVEIDNPCLFKNLENIINSHFMDCDEQ